MYKRWMNLNCRDALLLVFVGFTFGCASSTQEGAIRVHRKQFFIIPSSQIESMSAQAYDQVKSEAAKKNDLDQNKNYLRRVQAVADRLIPQTIVFRDNAKDWKWEVHVITSTELNAYCMPGGKIMFYSAIIEKLSLTDAEIAAIMGHEMSHALREHGRERMSQQLLESLGLALLVETGTLDARYAQAATVVSSVALDLPHSRNQESEADAMGVELMARAGYNPEDAVRLWKKMSNAGGSKPPEILSTHPTDATRIARIEALIPTVMPLFTKANAR